MSKSPPNTTAALASHLGISRWTVSRVLNGHSGVKEETVRKVKQAIRRSRFPAKRARPRPARRPDGHRRRLFPGSRLAGARDARGVAPATPARGRLPHGDRTFRRQRGTRTRRDPPLRGAARRWHRADLFPACEADDPAIRLLEREKTPCFWVDPEHPVPGDRFCSIVPLDEADSRAPDGPRPPQDRLARHRPAQSLRRAAHARSQEIRARNAAWISSGISH